ncbi:unknown [Firmicutes bacterium CAG:822]|nr:unknown [Firmicutes bacterium CAG:822]
MKKKVVLIIVLIIIVVVAIGTYLFLQNNESKNTELENKMETASRDYFEKYVSANDSENVYKITLQDLEDANKAGEEYDLKGLEKCDKTNTFANVTINYKDGTAKKAQVELKC